MLVGFCFHNSNFIYTKKWFCGKITSNQVYKNPICNWLTKLENSHSLLCIIPTNSANKNLHAAKAGKKDKFYIQPMTIMTLSMWIKPKDIPSNYPGAMGVPITFLDKYNPDQFEIVKFRKGDDDKDLTVGGKSPYFRIVIKNKKVSQKQ
jgi:hypothetical protein